MRKGDSEEDEGLRGRGWDMRLMGEQLEGKLGYFEDSMKGRWSERCFLFFKKDAM